MVMKTKKVTIEDLAVMVQTGFSEAGQKTGEGFDGLEKRMDGLEKRMDGLEQGQEEIKLKLDNVAYRFELVELQRRGEILEKKLGAKRS